jgi:hypothetical protein
MQGWQLVMCAALLPSMLVEITLTARLLMQRLCEVMPCNRLLFEKQQKLHLLCSAAFHDEINTVAQCKNLDLIPHTERERDTQTHRQTPHHCSTSGCLGNAQKSCCLFAAGYTKAK